MREVKKEQRTNRSRSGQREWERLGTWKRTSRVEENEAESEVKGKNEWGKGKEEEK